MKRISYFTLLLASLVFAMSFAWADGNETRTLDNFDKISASTGVNVTLVHSNTTKADIETEGVEPSEVVTEVTNGKLKVKFKKSNNWGKKRNANVTVYYKTLIGVDVSSGATVKSDDALNAQKLDVDVSSGATCQLEIDCGDLTCDVSSGATLRLSGKCSSQNVDVSSGASYRAEGLNSASASVDASSGASAQVWVSDNLEASASSGGSVKYKGEPKSTKLDKSFSGSVKKM